MIYPGTPSVLSTVSAINVSVGDYIKGKGPVKRVIHLERVSMVEVRLDQNRVCVYPEEALVQVLRNN